MTPRTVNAPAWAFTGGTSTSASVALMPTYGSASSGGEAARQPRRRSARAGFSGAYDDWIARVADAVEPGATIFLDASGTSVILAKALSERPSHDLTIVTNSLRITGEDLQLPARVLVCPGNVNQRVRAIEGPLTLAFLLGQRVDTAFVRGGDPIAAAARSIADRTVDLALGDALR